MEFKEIQISKVKPNPRQPREHFDKEKIVELANSIQEADLLQPIVITKKGKKYQIVAGERRFRAFRFLKRKTIPAIIWNIKDDIDGLEKSAIENLQREDLTSVERENVVTDLWNSGRYKTYRQLATKLGYNQQTTVSELIEAKQFRLEETLPGSVSSRVIRKTRSLEPEERREIFKKIEKGYIGESRIEEEVKLIKLKKELKKKFKIEIPPELKKANFIIDHSRRFSDLTTWVQYCGKIPLEVWQQAFDSKQLKQITNVAIALYNELTEWLEKMEVLE